MRVHIERAQRRIVAAADEQRVGRRRQASRVERCAIRADHDELQRRQRAIGKGLEHDVVVLISLGAAEQEHIAPRGEPQSRQRVAVGLAVENMVDAVVEDFGHPPIDHAEQVEHLPGIGRHGEDGRAAARHARHEQPVSDALPPWIGAVGKEELRVVDQQDLATMPDRREVGEVDQHAVGRARGQDELLPSLRIAVRLLDEFDRAQHGLPLPPRGYQQAGRRATFGRHRGEQRVDFADEAIGHAVHPVHPARIEFAVEIDRRRGAAHIRSILRGSSLPRVRSAKARTLPHKRPRRSTCASGHRLRTRFAMTFAVISRSPSRGCIVPFRFR